MYLQGQNGLMRTWHEGWRSRGWAGILVAFLLIAFYLVLYFEDKVRRYVGFRPLTPIATALHLENRWYLYGFLYCVVMIGGGVYYLRRHGNSRYNQIRIGTNIAVQVALGFTLPFVMHLFGSRDYYFSYLWPLKIEYFYPQDIGHYPAYIAVYSLVASLVIMPLMALRYGKRWYCSWVCGCGGLANTFGDPWRHLTDTSTKAWRFEKVTVHSVMVLAVLTTLVVGADFFVGDSLPWLHSIAAPMREWYGFVVGAILAGVVGVGLYPLMGPRAWCRNFCPMAAMLGLIQKAGRFRIRVKEDMCISCGNCSSYCEMGIDVRDYAQRNESFTRASCVGCGMCAHVCPRGVLKLENVSKSERRPEPKRRLPLA